MGGAVTARPPKMRGAKRGAERRLRQAGMTDVFDFEKIGNIRSGPRRRNAHSGAAGNRFGACNESRTERSNESRTERIDESLTKRNESLPMRINGALPQGNQAVLHKRQVYGYTFTAPLARSSKWRFASFLLNASLLTKDPAKLHARVLGRSCRSFFINCL